eukprot:CFRG3625T1
MFGWGTKGTKPSPKSANPPPRPPARNAGSSLDFRVEGMDPSLMNPELMGEFEVDESELEAELLALSGGLPTVKKKTTAKPYRQSLDEETNYQNVMAGAESIVNDDLTADDFDDDDLMAEFAAIGGDVNELKQEATPQPKPKPKPKPPAPFKPPAQTPSAAAGSNMNEEDMEAKIRELKGAALAAKKAGNTEKAVEFMREAKGLAALQVSSGGGKRTSPPATTHTLKPTLPSPSESSSAPTQTPASTSVYSSSKPSVDSLDRTQRLLKDEHGTVTANGDNVVVANQLSVVVDRQNGYKRAASAAKRENNLPLALKCMRIMKNMDPFIEKLHIGLAIDMSALPPKYEAISEQLKLECATPAPAPTSPPIPKPVQTQARPPAVHPRTNSVISRPQSTLSTPSSLPRSSSASATKANVGLSKLIVSDMDKQAKEILTPSESNEDIYDDLTAQLTAQHLTCAKMAREYLQRGDKSSAVTYHSLSKVFDADRKRLAVAKQQSHIPQYHYEARELKSVKVFPELTLAELELVIVDCKGIPKDVLSYGVYIEFEFPFPSDKAQTGTTPIVKESVVHTFNHCERITIARSKAFSRVVNRPKFLTLTMKYKRFFSVRDVGTAKVSLADLQSKAEINDTVEFALDRKGIGCSVSVRMRIRQPLEGNDEVVEHVQWVHVDSTTPASSRPSSLTTPACPPPNQATPAKSASSAAMPIIHSQTTADTPQQVDLNADPYADGDMRGDPTSVSGIISNNVLEWMAASAAKIKNECRETGQTPPDDLEDRIIAINTAMQLLVMQIQSGALDVNEYLQSVREAIANEKKLALELKKKGKTEWAVAAMTRAKLMMEELKENDPNQPDIPVRTRTSPPPHPLLTPAPTSAQPYTKPPIQPPARPRSQEPVQPQLKVPSTLGTQVPKQSNKKRVTDEDVEGDPMDVNGHVSNEVLEWEVDQCTTAIAACKAKRQEPDEQLIQKRQTAELMIQMLIIQIQTEKLSIDDYCARVKSKIVEEKRLAAKLKAKGNIEWAKAALIRAKIMEKELEG